MYRNLSELAIHGKFGYYGYYSHAEIISIRRLVDRLHRYGVAARLEVCFLHLLQFSMEHHKCVRING